MEYPRCNRWKNCIQIMARKNEDTRHSNFVIRIVCEGDKTEPLFFSDLCNTYYYGNEYYDVRTIPHPPVPEEDKDINHTKRGWHKGKKRQVKGPKIDNDITPISGQPPLKWVRHARQILSEGVDEAWVVYDKDEHPKHKEALEEASMAVDGKIVNVAFSSRSFEYYLLLHFEYLYYPFSQTECGERINGNKHIFECGTDKMPDKDCHGRICINGYARTKGYWTETKSEASTFPLVKDKLIKGMVNACRLRCESDANTELPIYERNPYTYVDRLVGRLIGKYPVPFDTGYHICDSGRDYVITLTGKGVEIVNQGEKSVFFSKEKIIIYDWENSTVRRLSETPVMIQPHEKLVLECSLDMTEVVSIMISAGKEILLLPKY